MSGRPNFDDALDAAISELMRGGEARLSASAGEALDPLVETAALLARSAGATSPPAPSGRLAENVVAVRAAALRARMAQVSPAPLPYASHPWWRRRISFASLTLPAGLLAGLAVLGVTGGAAAGLVLSTTSLPDTVQNIVGFEIQSGPPRDPSVAPAAHTTGTASNGAGSDPEATSVAPGGHGPNGTPRGSDATGRGTPGAGATHPAGGPPGADRTQPPGAGNGPGPPPASSLEEGAITVAGVIEDINGNTFTLRSAEGDFKVTVNAGTLISGEIGEGANATVTGSLTAGRNLRGEMVTVTSTSASSTPETAAPPGGGDGNGSGVHNGDGPGGENGRASGNGGASANSNGPPN